MYTLRTSVVLPIKNRRGLLEHGVRSLLHQDADKSQYEVVVVDYGSNDDPLSFLETVTDLNWQYLRIDSTKAGYTDYPYINPALAINVGVKQAEGGIIVISCPEVIHARGNMARYLEGPNDDEFWLGWVTEAHAKDVPDPPFDREALLNVAAVQGLCVPGRWVPQQYFIGVIWRETFLRIGGIDEDYMAGIAYEDEDLANRFKLTGIKPSLREEIVGIHLWHSRTYQGDQRRCAVNSQLCSRKKLTQPVANVSRVWGSPSCIVNRRIHRVPGTRGFGTKVVGFLQVYNEMTTGELPRVMDNILEYCDDVVVYDDASTDGSYEYLKSRTPNVLRGATNDWKNEIDHKRQLLARALDLGADWILWIDSDEEIRHVDGPDGLHRMLASTSAGAIDLLELNLWNSSDWIRMDGAYGSGIFRRLWRNSGGLHYPNIAGLHKAQFPNGLGGSEMRYEAVMLHRGFMSPEKLKAKYTRYKSHGQSGWDLERLIDERGMKTVPLPAKLRRAPLNQKPIPAASGWVMPPTPQFTRMQNPYAPHMGDANYQRVLSVWGPA